MSTMMRTHLLLAVGVIGYHNPALSQSIPKVNISNLAVTGDGCPPGQASSVLSEDGSQLLVLFKSFTTELAPAGTLVANPRTRGCTVAFAVQVPAGTSISWYGAETLGYVNTSGGANGQLILRYYQPGVGGFDSIRTSNFNPGLTEPFAVTDDNLDGSWSACGGSQLMSMNLRTRLSGEPNGYSSLVIHTQSRLKFRYRPCM